MDPMQNPEERFEEQPGFEGSRSQPEEKLEAGWRKTQEGIRSMKEQAGESLEAARQRLREGARNAMIHQKERSVGGLRRLSLAIHEAAAKLDEEGDHTLAEYTELLGGQVEKAAKYLQDRDPATVLQDMEDVARRQAGLIIGGMFVTGLVLARLIKASQASREVTPTPSEPAPTIPPETSAGTTSPTSTSRFGSQGFGPL